jgi:hypothetical protein
MNKKKTYSFNKKISFLIHSFLFCYEKSTFCFITCMSFWNKKKYHYLDGFNFEKVDNTLNRKIEFQKIFIQILKQP